MSSTINRVVRTFVQLVAAGGLTSVIAALTTGLDQQQTAMVLAASTLAVTFCQNFAEDAGWIKPLLK